MSAELVDVTGSVKAWMSGQGRSNSTLVGSAELIVCIDSLHAPSLARHVLSASEEQFGRSPDVTVYTHFHGDHIVGAETIGSTLVVSHRNTRTFLSANGEGERDRIAGGNADLSEEIRSASVLLPGAVFDETLQIHLGDVAMDLLYVGPSHTDSDIVCHLPDSGVLIAGDVVVAGVLPVLRDADVRGWMAALDRLTALDVESVVPGHGPVTDRSSIVDMQRLFETVTNHTWTGLDRGLDVVDILSGLTLPAPFDSWGRQERLEPMVRRIADQATEPERSETR